MLRVDAASARHPASLLAKQAAVLLTSSVKTQKNSKCTRCRHNGGIFCRTKLQFLQIHIKGENKNDTSV